VTVTARRKGCFNFLCSATATPGCSVEFYPSMQHFLRRKCYVINISCLQNRVLHTAELVGRVFQNAV
jgi:hypothetical protein